MAATTLVEPKITEGRALLQVLDQTPVQPFAAFWLWNPEAEAWDLVIGSDLVDRTGPTSALAAIQRVLSADPRLSEVIELGEILVVGRRNWRLKFLRGDPTTGRLQGAVVGGQFVEDAYVYRNAGPGRVTELRAAAITDRSITVEWLTNATMEVRVALYRDGRRVEGPLAVPSPGPPRLGLLSPPAKRFDGLQPGTTYRVVVETDDDQRELTITTQAAP